MTGPETGALGTGPLGAEARLPVEPVPEPVPVRPRTGPRPWPGPSPRRADARAEAGPAAEPEDDPAAPAPLHVPRTPTGNAEVDAQLDRLADADHLATDGHVEVYEDVHRGLRDALTALDARPGPPGPPPPYTAIDRTAATATGAEPNVAGVARRRLDAELVRRKLARSREHAGQLIAAGRVTVGKTLATKSATQVETAAAIVVTQDDDDPDYVSRGGHKLAGALEAFVPLGLAVEGRRALDAGASTGGFTDVLLRAGVAHVVAVDVGYGQLAWSLQSDERVTVKDRTNVRELTLEAIDGEPVDLVVGDLSFIPLGLVLPALVRCAAPGADLVMMVKPQFEVGRERLGSGGVVRSPELRADAVRGVARQAGELGLGVNGVTASPLPGPSGNVEYFLWLRAGAPALDPADVDRAVAEGPR